MKGVRVRDHDFEGQCNYCLEFLPLTPEFWPMNNAGVRRCKACLREYKTLKEAGYRASQRDLRIANQRATYRALSVEEKARRNAVNREWKAKNRERVRAYAKAYYWANRERLLEAGRNYYRTVRDAA